MLKTQITGAKYLSPQTNQMTNLNIAVPADSKDTEFGTSDILLAKDVVAYLNALDSDISNELDAQTDKINKINESIKQLIDHNLIKIVTELPTTDIDKNCIYLVPNKDGEGNNVFVEYIYVESKNTFEEVGRILAKVDLSDYYTKEETDNLILIAKNSAINIHNEDNTKYITLDINDPHITGEDDSAVNISMFDIDYPCFTYINAKDGFTHNTDDGYTCNLYGSSITINDTNNANSIEITTNKELTEEEQADEYSPVDILLTDGHNSANINTGYGFTHKTKDGLTSSLDYYGLYVNDGTYLNQINSNSIVMYNNNVNGRIELYVDNEQPNGSPINMSLTDGDNRANINAVNGFDHTDVDGFVGRLTGGNLRMLDLDPNPTLETSVDCNGLRIYHLNTQIANFGFYTDKCEISLGTNKKFKISRPADNTEGATITGVKSIAAFANPSATKVWATDGSTVDLTTKADTSDLATKANASDVLLKKSSSGGYYVETNYNLLGSLAFAANDSCTASGSYSFAEGASTKAIGACSHAEGYGTKALGNSAHAEGQNTEALGNYSHAEGQNTEALGNYSHAEGLNTTARDDFSHAEGSNTDAQHGSHAEGNYTQAVGSYTHAEGEYTSASGSYSHAEGFATHSNGDGSHSEGYNTIASGYSSHALGIYNVDNKNAIHSVGIGNSTTKKNAEYIYAKNDENGYGLADDPKNGYKYLIGIGGYDGISTDNSTYKSVQEVIADLTARIEQLETKVRALEAANTPA